jgi:hypothetical protein
LRLAADFLLLAATGDAAEVAVRQFDNRNWSSGTC